TGVVDDKRHHAGIVVFGRPRHQRKSADHLALDDIAQRPARRALPLAGEDAVVVTMIGLRLSAGLVALRRGFGGDRTERAVVAVRLPVQAVLLTGARDDSLGVGADAVAVILLGIFVLRVDEREARLDGIELVASD